MMEFEEFFLAPTPTSTATATHPGLLDPTSFPTVYPDKPIWQTIGPNGHRTLWVVFALMLVSFLAFSALSWSVPASKRIFHSLTTTIVLISGLSYFIMATGGGFYFHRSLIRHKHDHGVPDTFQTVHRQVHWIRYVELMLTSPLILADLALLSGLNGSNLFSAIVADLVIIVAGFFGATAWGTKAKWGWFVIAIIAYLWVVYTLAMGTRTARAKGTTVSKFYIAIMSYTVIVWLAYPIIWTVASSTGRRMAVDGEVLAYGILDVLSKGVFGAWLLYTYQRVADSHIVVGGFWTHGLSSEGRLRVGDEEDGA